MNLDKEIFVKYLNGELSNAEATEIKRMLGEHPGSYEEFIAVLAVHNKLKMVKELEPSQGFTLEVMKGIAGLGKRRTDNFFIWGISSVFIFLCLIILGFVGYNILSQPASASTGSILDKLTDGVNFLIITLQDLKTSAGLSIIGAVFSFIILVTAYFFFEQHKNLEKLK